MPKSTKSRMLTGVVAAVLLVGGTVGGLALRSEPVAEAQASASFDIFEKTQGPLGVQDISRAVYLRELGSGACWVDGDRIGYFAAWTFLLPGCDPANPAARVAFRAIQDEAGLAYSVVFDERMVEGQRRFDGSICTGCGNQTTDVRDVRDNLMPPEPYGPLVDGPIPIITFSDTLTGEVLEVRNYNNVSDVGPNITFRIVNRTATRTTVVAYLSGLPVLVVYYDVLNPSVQMTTNIDVVPTGPTGPVVLECFVGDMASESDGHLEAFRVCKV